MSLIIIDIQTFLRKILCYYKTKKEKLSLRMPREDRGDFYFTGIRHFILSLY